MREGVPELLSVGGYTDLPTTIESAGATPVASVVYEGAAKGARAVPGAAVSSQLWTVAVLVRKIGPRARRVERSQGHCWPKSQARRWA